MADQSVVGVVPLRSLGVHPDATVDDQVAQFRQHGNEQFLQERNLVDAVVIVQQQSAVGAPGAYTLLDKPRQLFIVVHRVLGIPGQCLERPDPVGYVGIAE